MTVLMCLGPGCSGRAVLSVAVTEKNHTNYYESHEDGDGYSDDDQPRARLGLIFFLATVFVLFTTAAMAWIISIQFVSHVQG